jgi:hypothetical protein
MTLGGRGVFELPGKNLDIRRDCVSRASPGLALVSPKTWASGRDPRTQLNTVRQLRLSILPDLT